MGIRSHDNKGLNTILVLSGVLREPQIHDCTMGGRHRRRPILSRAIFRFNLSVHARRFELGDRHRALLRQHRSWSDDHCQRECPN